MPLTRYDFLAAVIIGTVVGTVILGIGGRMAMRLIGMLQGLPPGFSFGGSMTVVFLGAVAGTAGGLILALAGKLFPTSRMARGALYWGAVLFLTLRGLRPIDELRLLVFVPLVALFGAVLLLVWCRVYLRRVAGSGATGFRGRVRAILGPVESHRPAVGMIGRQVPGTVHLERLPPVPMSGIRLVLRN